MPSRSSHGPQSVRFSRAGVGKGGSSDPQASAQIRGKCLPITDLMNLTVLHVSAETWRTVRFIRSVMGRHLPRICADACGSELPPFPTPARENRTDWGPCEEREGIGHQLYWPPIKQA